MSVPRSHMNTLMATVEELAVGIGPRGSTSDAERRASEYVAQYLRSAGFETSIESFRSVTSFSWTFSTFFASFDAIIPLSQGRCAISIMAFDVRGRLPNWHWHTDTINNIELETITIARDLVAYIIRSIAW